MKLQPFRTDTLKDPEATRLRLNEMVRALNDSAGAVSVVRIPNVQSGMTLKLPAPGFFVGAILIGGIWSTAGGAAPTSAPWAKDWLQQQDGSITLTIGGLPTSLTPYAVSLVLLEGAA